MMEQQSFFGLSERTRILGTKAGKVAKGAVRGAIAAPGAIAGVPGANMVRSVAASAVEGFVKDAIDNPAPSNSPQSTRVQTHNQ